MNTYIINTTTDDRWEICGGTYIVNAMTKKEALGFRICPSERVIECKKMDTVKKGLRFKQCPMVE